MSSIQLSRDVDELKRIVAVLQAEILELKASIEVLMPPKRGYTPPKKEAVI